MKRILFSTVVLSGLMASAAVTVSVNRAQQRFPWNGLVDVDFALSGTTDGTGYRLDLALVDGDHEYPAETFRTEPVVGGDGAHRVTWDFGKDHPEVALTNVTVKVGVVPLADTDPLYLVFDLSEGPTATSYPHRYTTHAPNLDDDTCRTTELWMRRIPAGQFTMGWSGVSGTTYSPAINHLPSHQVVLSKPYYIGIFEVTQGQYAQLTGEWPSYFSNVTYRATRPVETVSYQTIRSMSGWYDNPPTVASSAKLYVWRNKCGFPLDFPTEAQWECACRAGTHDYTYWPGPVSAGTLGRCNEEKPTAGVDGDTAPDVGGTAKVGSYAPNLWGLYDMMGNVQELVGDGNAYNNGKNPVVGDYAGAPYTDPRGPTPECAERMTDVTITYVGAIASRDGSWNANSTSMLVYQRSAWGRSEPKNKANTLGFRLCITCD